VFALVVSVFAVEFEHTRALAQQEVLCVCDVEVFEMVVGIQFHAQEHSVGSVHAEID